MKLLKFAFQFCVAVVVLVVLYNKYGTLPYQDEYIRPEKAPHVLDSSYRNICLNGKDKNSLSLKQQLEEFKKGPCSPYVFVNGLYMASLVVEIDCEVLRDQSPDAFSKCYWNSCDKDFWPIYRKPAKEYQFMGTSMFNPLGQFNPFSADCMWALLEFKWNLESENLSDVHKQRKGVRLTYIGDTEETKKTSKCGFDTHRDIFGSRGHIEDFNSYRKMMDTFSLMGYTPGLTMQNMPYVTQLHWESNTIKNEILGVLKRLRRTTGKKVIIGGHSMGNIQLYASQLSKIKNAAKSDQISHYDAFFAPLTGDSHAIKFPLGWAPNSALEPFYLSMKKWLTIYAGGSWSFSYYPWNTWEKHQDYDYMKKVKQHMDHERDPYQPKGFKWWPDSSQKCYKNTSYDDKCGLGLEDSTKHPMTIIAGKEYYPRDSEELLKKYSLLPKMEELIEKHKTPLLERIQNYENPQVPIVVYFTAAWESNNRSEYYKEPFEDRENAKQQPNWKDYSDYPSYNPDRFIYNKGDKNVNTDGQLLPYLKWANDYDQKQEGAKPVKFVNYCSQHRNKYTPYDGLTDSHFEKTKFTLNETYSNFVKFALNSVSSKNKKPLGIENNEYIGLYCKCMENDERKKAARDLKGLGNGCDHANFTNDDSFQYFFANSQLQHQKSDSNNTYFETEEQIEEYVNNCSLRYSIEK